MPGPMTDIGAAFFDGVKFQHRILGRRLWKKQQDIVRAIATNPLVAIKGCHASGKTHCLSGEALGWLLRHCRSAGGKVLVTAPTLRQVKTFIRECALARHGSPILRQLIPEFTTTGLELSLENFLQGVSSSAGVNLQGYHGKKILILCDEAPGIKLENWEAIEGIRSGGQVHLVKAGNPVVPSGEFYDAFGKARSIHTRFSISALDTPNFTNELTGEPLTIDELMELPDERIAFAPFPFLITRAWVKERVIVWGRDHPQFKSRVLAEFPDNDPYSLFPLAWIERAQRDPTEKDLDLAKKHVIQVGIDVAGAGSDETVLVARAGGVILETHAWTQADPEVPVLRVLGALKHRRDYRLGRVVVDIIGVGYYFARWLASQGFDVWGFVAGATPLDPSRFANLKAEASWTLREWMREDLISGITDMEMQAQLSSIRYRENDRGLVEIESKDERNSRGIPGSPDRQEAAVLAFARVLPQSRTVVHDEGFQISPV